MSTTDCRTLHVYRLPVYQKRVIGIDKYISSSHVRSLSPNRTVYTFRRRHSTPIASKKSIIDVNSPSSNAFTKYYRPHTRLVNVNKEQNPVKSPSRPISLVKLRHQDERVVRIVTTPTSIKSATDIILPVAKKNRNTIVETPSSGASESQSINRNISTTKRGKSHSVDLERNVFLSDEDFHEKSSQDDTCKLKSTKWCRRKCPCQLLNCNFCHCYCSCLFCRCILCILLALAFFIGLIILIRFLSN